jgi:hypothetical protein
MSLENQLKKYRIYLNIPVIGSFASISYNKIIGEKYYEKKFH